MERSGATAPSLSSVKTKRRRTASSSPRRVLISGGTIANQRRHDKIEDISSNVTKERRKSKRRSSMRRRSLVATLEVIQSNNAGKPDRNGGDQSEEKGLAACMAPTVDSVTSGQNGVKTSEKVPTALSESISNATSLEVQKGALVESGEDSLRIAPTENSDLHYIQKLKAECDGWVEQLHRYKCLEQAIPDFKISTALNLEEVNAKYDFWDEQVSTLEDKLAASITVVNASMQRIDELRSIHAERVRKAAKDAFDNAVQERGGDDAKLLMKKIFMLQSMITDR